MTNASIAEPAMSIDCASSGGGAECNGFPDALAPHCERHLLAAEHTCGDLSDGQADVTDEFDSELEANRIDDRDRRYGERECFGRAGARLPSARHEQLLVGRDTDALDAMLERRCTELGGESRRDLQHGVLIDAG
jgi:hypothetical protein